MKPLIEVDNVLYAYPVPGREPLPALRDISLRIEAGEYVAIVGANGSGKSTLARHLNALLVPQTGHVRIAGLDTRDSAAYPDIRRTVGMVFQRPEDQLIATMVEEDVAFGPENMGVPAAEIKARVRDVLEAVGLWEERARPPHMLSAGQMQRVALAGVLAMRPRCIVFDEATAMLDPAGRRAVREMMAQLHSDGLTIITITHFMEEAVDAERVIVLDRGHMALDASPRVIFSDTAQLGSLGLTLPPVSQLAHSLCEGADGRCCPHLPGDLLTVPELVAALDQEFRQGLLGCPNYLDEPGAPCVLEGETRADDVVIEVHGLEHTYMQGTPLAMRALENVAFSVPSGSASGLLGATGAGKSTLLQHLNGLLRPQAGYVRVWDFDLHNPDVDVRQVRRLVGLVFQMPEMQIFEQYVGDEIAYGPRIQGFKGLDLRERVRGAMEAVGLDFALYKDRLTFTLSGGERRKVALASTLALRPKLLLLDEPTAGLDPVSRVDLLQYLQGLRASGMTFVLSSHRMADLAALTSRLTVMAEGTVVFGGRVEKVFAQGARLRALGLGVPVVTEVVDALRARGWPLPPGLISSGRLIDCIAQRVRDGGV